VKHSLHRRLLIILSVSVVAAWLATAFFTYWDTKRQINTMLDEGMVQSANLILSLLDHLPPEDWKNIILKRRPDQMVAYRFGGSETQEEAASPDMPDHLERRRNDGFSSFTNRAEKWRLYKAVNDRGSWVEIAQRQKVRDQMAENVATHIIHPVWLAVPLLAAMIWLSIRWGLTPLQTVARYVGSREASNLQPIKSDDAPSEIRPLITALNQLFQRIDRSMEKERQFTDDAAHELRTPLAAIKTHADVALQASSKEERIRAVQSLVEGADRAIRLVHQLLILARLDHQTTMADQTSVNLNDCLIDSVIEEMPNATTKNIDLGISGKTDGTATVEGNGDLLRILIGNIVSNAIRYTAPEGTVTVAVHLEATATVLEVNDSGPGIPEESFSRVFDRFYRVEGSSEQGCGLGLSIASRVAEIHGAHIQLENASPTGGLQARVIFPMPDALPSQPLKNGQTTPHP